MSVCAQGNSRNNEQTEYDDDKKDIDTTRCDSSASIWFPTFKGCVRMTKNGREREKRNKEEITDQKMPRSSECIQSDAVI